MSELPEIDRLFLDEKLFQYELRTVGSEQHLIIRDHEFPHAYNPRTADILIRILPPYPLGPLDMFYTNPHIKLQSGAAPQAADVYETLGDKQWQRWSRHGAWRPGIDNLRSFVTSVFREIEKGL